MREILFRGKRTDNGEWVEGFYLYTKENTHPVIIDMKCCSHIIDPETVGQYTGLTDKNGVKIFEGDIVKFVHDGKFIESKDSIFGIEQEASYIRNYKIEYVNTFVQCGWRFINGSIHFPCKQSTLSTHDCEVIGNIHDNPELLKGGDDNE